MILLLAKPGRGQSRAAMRLSRAHFVPMLAETERDILTSASFSGQQALECLYTNLPARHSSWVVAPLNPLPHIARHSCWPQVGSSGRPEAKEAWFPRCYGFPSPLQTSDPPLRPFDQVRYTKLPSASTILTKCARTPSVLHPRSSLAFCSSMSPRCSVSRPMCCSQPAMTSAANASESPV